MKIRKYDPRDRDKLVEIWYEASIIAHDFIPKQVWASHKDELKNTYLRISETWVAEEEGKAIGFISLMDHYIGGLFVAPAMQGMGVGTQLIQRAQKEKEHLTVGVYSKNAGAKSFYLKHGFVNVSEELQPETGEMVVNMQTQV